MKLETRVITDAVGTVLVHNVAFPSGRLALRKGTHLDNGHIKTLQKTEHAEILVAILDEDDVPENEAARRMAEALQTNGLCLNQGAGGRINFRAEVDSLLVVNTERLLQLNLIPGITLATRLQYALVGPHQTGDEVATLKIIPYAVPQADLITALELARIRPGIIELRPIPVGRQVALLLIGEPAVHKKLCRSFETPIRTRLERLGAVLSTIEVTPSTTEAIGDAAARLAAGHDLLIIAGQTSIMDSDDVTLRALRLAGAEVVAHGAPVEPGNLLALAYFSGMPVLCAPGCIRSLSSNVVDLILPRLLLGERLGQTEIAHLALGGLLK
ncbi:MAG: molybdopterin-binding protein [Anaerolineae bacterium]|nr:molybdopterin-binding protein [Anaerolineae bacterium]